MKLQAGFLYLYMVVGIVTMGSPINENVDPCCQDVKRDLKHSKVSKMSLQNMLTSHSISLFDAASWQESKSYMG